MNTFEPAGTRDGALSPAVHERTAATASKNVRIHIVAISVDDLITCYKQYHDPRDTSVMSQKYVD